MLAEHVAIESVSPCYYRPWSTPETESTMRDISAITFGQKRKLLHSIHAVEPFSCRLHVWTTTRTALYPVRSGTSRVVHRTHLDS